MGNHTQVDETYVGGKEMNKYASEKLNAGRGTVGKTAVVGIRDQHGQVRATPTERTTGTALKAFVVANAPAGATVVTDQNGGYIGLKGLGFTHKRVNHSVGEFVLNITTPTKLKAESVRSSA